MIQNECTIRLIIIDSNNLIAKVKFHVRDYIPRRMQKRVRTSNKREWEIV